MTARKGGAIRVCDSEASVMGASRARDSGTRLGRARLGRAILSRGSATRFGAAIRRPNSALRFGGRAAGAQPSIAGSMRASTEGQPRFIPS